MALDLRPALLLEEKIVEHDRGSNLARWEFGRWLLDQRKGKKLPNGLLAELVAATGKSRSELQYRVQFAERYSTKKALSKVLDSGLSWHDIISAALPAPSIDWWTPEDFIEPAREVLGSIDLDPASCAAANEVVKATDFFDISKDGLLQPWHGGVWMNPPYCGKAKRWVTKLLDEHESGRVDAAIALLNGDRIAAEWMGPLRRRGLLCFPGRISFRNPQGEPGKPRNDSAIAYLGPDREGFMDVFSRYGDIVHCLRPKRDAA